MYLAYVSQFGFSTRKCQFIMMHSLAELKYFYLQEERLRVKDEHPDFSITEVAKELGRRWAVLDPSLKHSYEIRYQVSRISFLVVQVSSLIGALCNTV